MGVFGVSTCIFFGLLATATKSKGEIQEFNLDCPEVCGLYSTDDKIGPALHQGCNAFSEEAECNLSNLTQSKKEKKRRSGQTRVVGGQASTDPIPWLVAILFYKDYVCGGTLINSRFVITAAHCPCDAPNLCTRGMTELGEEPLRIKDEHQDNLGEIVHAYIGATEVKADEETGTKKMIWEQITDLLDQKPEHLTYTVDKMFIHPLLGTSKEHTMNPDLALAHLSRPVESFSDLVRPICLARPGGEERPSCPDSSIDRVLNPQQRKKLKLVATGEGDKVLGGCATVAGWGHKNTLRESSSNCTTDHSPFSLEKNTVCAEHWKVGDEDMEACTKKNLKTKDIIKPCRNLLKELKFYKTLEKKQGIPSKKSKYWGLDYNTLVQNSGSPVEIVIKKKGRKEKVYHCSKTRFTPDENKNGHGWCATKLNKRDKIERWGMCSKACTPESWSSMSFANMNLLTDEECKTLHKAYVEAGRGGGRDVEPNFEREFCAGKKRIFPQTMISFIRKKKTKSKKKEEKSAAKKAGWEEGKATKYWYDLQKSPRKKMLGISENYLFNWFIGGSDTCQGDSGGPLWRNIKVDDKIRATLLGVVSRGSNCAEFNSPAVYGSVSKNFDWIKETIGKEMGKDEEACPADLKSNWTPSKTPGEAEKGSDYQMSTEDEEKNEHYFAAEHVFVQAV